MFTEKHHPQIIEAKELDAYLARGWYRMGQTIFTTHFLFYEGNLFSAIWTRLPLRGYSFRKSLRKILNRNSRRFTFQIQKGNLNEEKEALYQKYRASYSWFQSPNLDAYLMDGATENVFDTHEISIYDDEKLVAFSLFDKGEKAMMSIIGVFDPEYATYSLGFYTMLLEVEYCLEHNFDYYYPGYIVPGRSKFDYKRRIGTTEEVQYYDIRRGKWKALLHLTDDEIPINKICQKLARIHSDLMYRHVNSQLLYYPLEKAHLDEFSISHRIDAPIFLNCFDDHFTAPRYLVFYNIYTETYSLCTGMRYEDFAFEMGQPLQVDALFSRRYMEMIFKKEVLVESKDSREIISKIMELKKIVESES